MGREGRKGKGLGDERMDEWRVCIEQCMSIAMCENEMGSRIGGDTEIDR